MMHPARGASVAGPSRQGRRVVSGRMEALSNVARGRLPAEEPENAAHD
jgi:hypothetical protein